MSDFEKARQLFLAALEHHKSERLADAEALYRQANTLVPGRLSVLTNLATVVAGQGRFAEAQGLGERALALAPDDPDVLAQLALCGRELGERERALGYLTRLVELKPGDALLHYNRANLFAELGWFDEALAGYSRVLELLPGDSRALCNQAITLARYGRFAEAIDSINRALKLHPDDVELRECFVTIVSSIDFSNHEWDADFQDLVFKALRTPWCRPWSIAHVALAYIHSLEDFRVCNDEISRRWPERPAPGTFLVPRIRANLLGQPLLLALLETGVVANAWFERFITAARFALTMNALEVSETDRSDLELLAFHCALARQCHINEYICETTPQEDAAVRDLGQRIVAASRTAAACSPHWLAAYASHAPLTSLQCNEWLERKVWPAPVKDLIAQQVQAPRVERELRDDIDCLTDIDDAVSLKVREQYEENPYPRWIGVARASRKASLTQYLRRRMPEIDFRTFARLDRIELLNAGCGTGQTLVETALRFDNLRILAIDLSLASLGYAELKAREYAVENIRFAQADILKLDVLKERFDFIESTGVLHHLHDPRAGLAVLRTLLKLDGIMKLALYSRSARRSVVAARELIESKGFDPTASGIRECRKEIANLPDGHVAKSVAGFADFYSLSDCRDLLFHVQEHQFTIPQMQTLLSGLGLEFLGFDLPPLAIDEFMREHPEKGACVSLDAWHQHELQRPDAFANMYQFWVRKAL